jgi:hypothetical protein
LIQATRVAVEELERQERSALTRAAFIGYQTAGAFGALKGGTTFEKYLQQLGLGKAVTKRGSIKGEKEKAHATAARVADLFNAAPVVKETAE